MNNERLNRRREFLPMRIGRSNKNSGGWRGQEAAMAGGKRKETSRSTGERAQSVLQVRKNNVQHLFLQKVSERAVAMDDLSIHRNSDAAYSVRSLKGEWPESASSSK